MKSLHLTSQKSRLTFNAPVIMAKILGLDLGTNSIGWAVVVAEFENGKVIRYNSIADSGVRIFPEGVEPTTTKNNEPQQR